MIALDLRRALYALRKRYVTPRWVRDYIERGGPPRPVVSNPPYGR